MSGVVPTEVGPDVALRVSRRIDWRFLLPDPRLGRTGYGGVPDESLTEALRVFADDLVTDLHLAASDSLDGAVLHLPKPADLAIAWRAVRPGGFLVAELHGPRLPWDRRVVVAGVTETGARWTRLGVTGARRYWLLPSRGACTMMVDLDDAASVRAALARNQGSRSGRAKALAGRMLQAVGLLPRVAPDVTVLAIKLD
jgi:hypothetical protein